MLPRAILAAITLLALPARPAAACPCAAEGPPCAEFWKASAVFRGRVDAIDQAASASDDPLRSRTITFTVLEPFSGASGRSTIQVTTPGSPAACGFPFSIGREYIVYASAGPGGTLTTNVCSRTAADERAAGDLAYARGLATGMPLGRIAGRVVLRYRDLARGRDVEKPMLDIPVNLNGAGSSHSVRTDRAGGFSAGGLDAGTYALELTLPEGIRFRSTIDRIALPDARSCADVKVSVIPDGRVTGRVLDRQRRPVGGLTVEVTTSSALASGQLQGERLQTITSRDGRYEFAGVPPGRFVVGINTRQEPDGVPRVMHPGVFEVARAASFVLAAGGTIALGDLHVPGAVDIAQVTGFVFDGHGAPVDGARVYLRGPGDRDFIIGEAVTTDFMGRFVLAAAAGHEYRLFAERARPGDARGRIDATDPIAFTASSSAVPLRLELRRP
jgi:hypothetical protein